MVNLAQVIKGLRAERAAHRKRLTVWRMRLLRLGSWVGVLDDKNQRGKGESLLPPRERRYRKPRKHAGQNCASRRPLGA